MGLSEQEIRDLLGVSPCLFSGSSTEMSGGKATQVISLAWQGEPLSACPECGGRMHSHGTRTLKVVSTPNLGQPTRLDIEFPRRRCPACSYMWQPDIEGVDAEHRMTDAAYADIAQRSLRLTFRDVAKEYPITHVTVKNVFEDYVRAHAERLRFKIPTFLGIDEKNFKRVGMVTVITDLETRTVFDLVEGRTQEVLDDYFSKLPGLEQVRWVSSDMYRPFWKSIAGYTPHATWVIDHFHVVKGANEALDAVRRSVQAGVGKNERLYLKKNMAYALRKRTRDLNAYEASGIREMREDARYGDIVAAYDLKEDFFDIYDENPNSREAAEEAFDRWSLSIPAAKLFDPFRALVKTVENHREYIFNWWDCPSRISNGYTECANRLIKETDMKGRGYSFETLRARTLYRRNNLERIMRSGGLSIGPRFDDSAGLFVTEVDGAATFLDPISGLTIDAGTGEVL